MVRFVCLFAVCLETKEKRLKPAEIYIWATNISGIPRKSHKSHCSLNAQRLP